MALSAEYFMVENQSIQTLLAARQKQIDYISMYMNSMSLTAALFVNTVMGGTYSGMIQGYAARSSGLHSANVTTSLNNFWNNQKWEEPGSNYSLVQNYSFWVVILLVTSAICAAAGVHCILTATYIVMWTQRMTLLGPAGSVARALSSVRSLQGHVKFSFFIMLVAFTANCIASFWLCDLGMQARSAITSLYAATFIFTAFSLRWIYKKHFNYKELRREQEDMTGRLSRRMSRTGSRPPRLGKSDNRTDMGLVNQISNNSDYFDTEKAKNGVARNKHHLIDEELQQELVAEKQNWVDHGHLQGLLQKRSEKGVRGYQERFVILEQHEFCYFKTKQKFEAGEDPEKKTVYNLNGYEVVVADSAFSGHYDFSLVPMPNTVAEGKRTWEFRCKEEQERVRWVRGFLAAVLSIPGDDMGHGRDTIVGDDTEAGGTGLLSPDGGSRSVSSQVAAFFTGGSSRKKNKKNKKNISFDLAAEMT